MVQATLPSVAQQVAQATRTALERGGGVKLARDAEIDSSLRESVCRPIVERLGLMDLDARSGADWTMAAGSVCQVAGSMAFPYPVVPLLARSPSGEAAFLVGPGGSRVDHGDMLDPRVVIEMDGAVRPVMSVSRQTGQRLGPFVVRVEVGRPICDSDDMDAALWLLLSSWWALGASQRAAELTSRYVLAREQFGGPLARLQSVRLKVADMSVALLGLEELARYTVGRLYTAPGDALVDALALRVFAHETVQLVFDTAHQLHGAVGFTEEYDLAILHRHLQPYVRLPFDYEVGCARLTALMERNGFQGLFGRFSGDQKRS